MFDLIVAATPKGEIGVDNRLPWNLRGDLQRFKDLTLGCTVVMGSNTFQSLLKLRGMEDKLADPLLGILPGRECIVVGKRYLGKTNLLNVTTVASMEDAKALVEEKGSLHNFIIGGAGLYSEALAYVDKVLVTVVYQQAERYDTVIKDFDLSEFELMWSPEMVFTTDENNFPIPSHAYCVYERKKTA